MGRAVSSSLLFAMGAAPLAITGCARRGATTSPSPLPPPSETAQPVVETHAPEDDDLTEELLRAAETGDADRVAELLAAGVDPHAAGRPRATALHVAAYRGHQQVAQLLLDRGADANAQTHLEYGYSGPLHGAAGGGDVELARLLIKHGAVVDLGDRWGCAPLHGAAECGHVEMVEFLLDNGARVNGQGFHRQKPLHYAARAGHLDVVKTLVRHGAEVNVQRKDGSTPLSRALEEGYMEVAEFLRAHGAKEPEELGPPR